MIISERSLHQSAQKLIDFTLEKYFETKLRLEAFKLLERNTILQWFKSQ